MDYKVDYEVWAPKRADVHVVGSGRESPEVNVTKKIKEETPMDELEADIVKTVDYHDNVISPLEGQRNRNDWQRASDSKWAEFAAA